MTVQVLMPKIGLTMTEGRITEWLKKEGDRVEKGELLFVFETEKVSFEVEATHSGVLSKILAPADEIVGVGEAVGLMEEAEGAAAKPAAETHAGETPGAASGVPEKRREPERLVPISGMRRTIAERMLAAKRETAQTYMAVSVDASNLLLLRERRAPAVKAAGAHLTITDLLLLIAARAISRHPVLNTRWTPGGIVWIDAIHMGVAVALEDGLIVPVIRDMGGRTLSDVSKERAALVERGKAGKLAPDDMTGSTFTLSSLGMFGVEEFTAIINPPESAILAAGSIMQKPVAMDGEVVIRPVMKLTLTYDHRVIDGAKAAEFMGTLKKFLEDPDVIVG